MIIDLVYRNVKRIYVLIICVNRITNLKLGLLYDIISKGGISMTIEQLKYFLVAAKYLNFSRAADALYVHQTTMSRNVAALEEEIGAPLFIRMKYSLQLTTVGRLLRDSAAIVIESFETMVEEVISAASDISGRLSMITPQTYFQMLAKAYGDFMHKNPQVEFSIDVCPLSQMDSVCQSVLSREVDMGITFSQNIPERSTELDFQKIYSETQYLTVPIDHHLAMYDSVKLSDIRNTKLLVGDHLGKPFFNTLYNSIDFSENSLSLTHSTSGETMLLQFTAGMGVMFMPGSIANRGDGAFKCIKVEDANFDFNILIAWRKDNRNPTLAAFLDEVRKHDVGLVPILKNE